MVDTSRYTLVTVAHRGDYGLMRLQARSLDKYLDRNLVEEIIVIENPEPGRPTNWRRVLSNEYGGLTAQVRFIEARAIADVSQISGWFSQQVLKLMSSKIVATEQYMILDGKNHLVHPLTRDSVETPSGLLRTYLMSYETHPMKPFLINTLEYFELDPVQHLSAFMPTTTPFTLPTARARELVRYVEEREQQPFPSAFVYDGYKRSEFFMFAAYLLSLGSSLGDIYSFSALRSPAIWPESRPEDCLQAIVTSEKHALPFFAVHRRVFEKLTDATRRDIAAFWYRRGLFDSMEAPLAFLMNPTAWADSPLAQ
jgi:hypothetical protein